MAAAMVLPVALGAGGCAKKNQQAQQPEVVVAEAVPANRGLMNSKPMGQVLKTTVFRMSGDYADKVAVTFDGAGKLIYFPAPTDITAASAPVKLDNGWWLNRQGISSGSVFTKYTFEEYSKLEKVPTQAELKAAVIPGAKVIEFRTLPIPASEAMERLDEINTLLQR